LNLKCLYAQSDTDNVIGLVTGCGSKLLALDRHRSAGYPVPFSPVDLEMQSTSAREAGRVYMQFKWERLQIGYKEE